MIGEASTAIEAARALVPSWVTWVGSAVYLAVVAAVAWFVARTLGGFGLQSLRRLESAHWTERARAIFPLKTAFTFLAPVLAVFAGFFAHAYQGAFSVIPESRLVLLGALLSFVVVVRGYLVTSYEWRGSRIGLGRWMGEWVAALLLLTPVVPALVFMGVAPSIHSAIARPLWLCGAVLTLAAASIGLPLLGLRKLGIVRDAPERLWNAVRTAGARVGHVPRACYVVPLSMANALAFPLMDRVAFTSSALALTDAELEAIAAHEIGHLGEPRSMRALRFVLGMLWVTPVVAFVYSRNANVQLASVIGVVWLRAVGASYLQRMEVRADAVAKTGEAEGGDYARALERLHELNLLPAVLFGPKTHPSLHDRMTAAGVQPTYPRPRPPSVLKGLLLAMLALVYGTVLHVVTLLTLLWLPHAAQLSDENQVLVRVAFSDDTEELITLAGLRKSAGRPEEAQLFYRAANALSNQDADDAAQPEKR